MEHDGSVAPKERVNIVYRPATGDSQAEIELPLKLLVVGDFTLQKSEVPVEERKPLSIDKDNFNDVFKGQNLSLKVQVPNQLDDSADPDDQLSFDLQFESINDFTPDSLTERIPELKRMLELRDALRALKSPIGNVPDFRNRLQELIADEGTRERLLNELGVTSR
jgi:type VI secretion system protein ImpB